MHKIKYKWDNIMNLGISKYNLSEKYNWIVISRIINQVNIWWFTILTINAIIVFSKTILFLKVK